MKEKTVEEKRAVERFSLQLVAVIRSINGYSLNPQLFARTKNISSNGLFLYTANIQPVGIRMEIDIRLPLINLDVFENDYTTLRVSGKIVRVEKSGIAVSINTHNYVR